jgi:uncharacterized protein
MSDPALGSRVDGRRTPVPGTPRKVRRRVLIAAGVVALLAAGGVAVVVASDRDQPPPIDRLVIAGGPDGSPYAALARALAGAVEDRWGVTAQALTTDGAVDNLEQIGGGRADIGFATIDAVQSATQGDAPFHSARPIVALAGLYEDYVQIVVPASTNIHQFSDLDGLRVSIGSKRSGTDIVAQRVLEAHGKDFADLTPVYLSAAESAEAMVAGDLQGFFVVGGLPTPTVDELAARMPVRLLPVPDDEEKLLERFGEFYLDRSIPAGLYGLEAEVPTVGIPNLLVVRRELAEPVAYALTKLLFEAKRDLVRAHPGARRLGQRSALATYPIPLHPGAVEYYREAKPMS